MKIESLQNRGEKRSSASERTRTALILAAGKLIAQAGHSACVTVRDIATEAGVNPALIKYHFGDKPGLVRALHEYIISSPRGDTMSLYLDRHRSLLDSRDGQSAFIAGLVDHFCAYFEGCEEWRSSLIYHIINQSHEMHEYYSRYYFKADAVAFYDIYRIITGDDDLDLAYCLFISVFVPLAIRISRGKYVINRLNDELALSDCFDKRFIYFSKRQLMIGLGLVSAEKQSAPSEKRGIASMLRDA